MTFTTSRLAIALGASTLLLAGAATAQQSPFSYNYVQGNVTQGEIGSLDYTSVGAELSLSLTDNVFLKGSVTEGESDDRVFSGPFSGKLDIQSYTLGLGYHTPINNRTDFVAEASYINNEASFRGFSMDSEGYGIDLGVRSMLTSALELQAALNYVDGSDMDGDIGFSVDARFYLSPKLSLSAGYFEQDEFDGLTASLRYNF